MMPAASGLAAAADADVLVVGAVAALIRPDHYLFGAAADPAVSSPTPA
jgi:hypothetical protein